MTGRAWALAWTALAAAAVAAALLLPHEVTDGDSCAYAAMGHDIATGASPWSAPRWDFHGASACFHEHPPGAFWVSAALEALGAPVARAALVANALWTLAAGGGVVALASAFVARPAACAAGAAFLLHVAVMRSVQRAGLEIPLAATSAWALAAGLRLARSPWWTALAAFALAAAFLVRGVFGLVPAEALLFLLAERTLRPPPVRLALALLGAAAALAAFDVAHHAATGHGFWRAYVERQVLPSLQPGGTSHAVEGPTWGYHLGRAALYALPWALLPLARLVRGPRPPDPPAAWRLAAFWIAVTLAGASVGTREGSRYVFLVYVATALLVALTLPRTPPAWLARAAPVALFTLLPVQMAAKTAFRERDAWWRLAEACESVRGDPRLAGARVHGPFQPEDDRLKSLLRFHLGMDVTSGPVPPEGGLEWVPADRGPPAGGRVVLASDLGSVVDRR